MRRLVLLLPGVLALAACGPDAVAGGAAADVEGEWQLTGGTAGGTELPAPPGPRATLELAGDEARGTAFCNRWFATVRLEGDALSLEGIGRTEMGCEPEVMAAESAYVAALAAVDTRTVDGDELVLTGDDVELRFRPVPAVPDSPLVGTSWVLESLVDGETASSVLGEPLLELAPDGTATGTTGCTAWASTWRRSGDVLALDPLPGIGCDADAPLAAQDGHVTAVLEAGPGVAVDGDRLILTADDGRGLVYRARP
ncbi:META domain-containing protein [Blastococcus sp. SYSU DS0617]